MVVNQKGSNQQQVAGGTGIADRIGRLRMGDRGGSPMSRRWEFSFLGMMMVVVVCSMTLQVVLANLPRAPVHVVVGMVRVIVAVSKRGKMTNFASNRVVLFGGWKMIMMFYRREYHCYSLVAAMTLLSM